jgi:hypothetical protein
MLGAKALFALAYVQLPFLVSDIVILSSHGFSPLRLAPALLLRQLIFACALTVPAMALAAMLGNFTQFVLGLLATGAVAVSIGAALEPNISIEFEDWLRIGTIAGIAVTAATAILCLQYQRKGTGKARSVGVATLLVVGGATFAPHTLDNRLQAALHPIAGNVSLRLDTRTLDPLPFGAPRNEMDVGIPMTISGIPSGMRGVAYSTSLTLTDAGGRQYRSPDLTSTGILQNRIPFQGSLGPLPTGATSQVLFMRFDHKVFESLKDRNVRIAGKAFVELVRKGQTAWMPIGGRVATAEVGRCSNAIEENRWGGESVRVLCESAGFSTRPLDMAVWTPEDGRSLDAGPAYLGNVSGGPGLALLSPLSRSKSFFRVVYTQTVRNPMELPANYLANARIGVTPEKVMGYAVVDFDLSDISLEKYVPEPYWAGPPLTHGAKKSRDTEPN